VSGWSQANTTSTSKGHPHRIWRCGDEDDAAPYERGGRSEPHEPEASTEHSMRGFIHQWRTMAHDWKG
jgi:hypothetical protein